MVELGIEYGIWARTMAMLCLGIELGLAMGLG